MSLPGDLDGRRYLRCLRRLGWHVVRQRGSHRVMVHVGTGRKVVVAFHGRIRAGAIRANLKLMAISEEDFVAAL